MNRLIWILIALFLVTCTAQGITLGIPGVVAEGAGGGDDEMDSGPEYYQEPGTFSYKIYLKEEEKPMALRLSEEEYAKLVAKKKKPATQPARKARQTTYHDWERQGNRYVCLRCGLGISVGSWDKWKTGQYRDN